MLLKMMLSAVVLAAIPVAAEAQSSRYRDSYRPRYEQDYRYAHSTPNQYQRRQSGASYYDGIARQGGGRLLYEQLPYGRTRAAVGVLRPSPYGSAMMMLAQPNTAYAPTVPRGYRYGSSTPYRR